MENKNKYIEVNNYLHLYSKLEDINSEDYESVEYIVNREKGMYVWAAKKQLPKFRSLEELYNTIYKDYINYAMKSNVDEFVKYEVKDCIDYL